MSFVTDPTYKYHFHPNQFPGKEIPPIIEVHDDISNLEAHLAREDYGFIVRDYNLFWLAFCKALSCIILAAA